jgi:uncharacterized protein (DUF1501 family)
MNSRHFDSGRREFLRQACCAAVGTTGILSAMSQLKLIGALAADSSSGPVRAAADADYKALVCLFLSGGNDGNNVLVPYDQSSYNNYATARGGIAVARSNLLPLSMRTYADGRAYGLNADLKELKPLFDQGKIAFLANVGTLLRPTTLADYKAGIALPNQLYSHLDQSTQWQSSIPDQPFRTGWGGRMADLVDAMNQNNQISMSISLSGSNYFQVGNSVSPYALSPWGAEVLDGYWAGGVGQDATRYATTKRLLDTPYENVLGSSFASATKSAVTASEYMATALRSAPTLKTVFPGAFPSGTTSAKLQMVAKLIAMAASMGLKRQLFFVNIGGYDVHAAQVEGHSVLLKELGAAMAAFYAATVELGVQNQVTTFTASDFGRSYNPNADGTDHAWGNLQWVMGGAVSGGDLYGKMPSLAVGGNDDTGRGRWIPSTSVDEYNSTLARWFGVSDANLPVVLPNIGRFAKKDLGFMA